MPKGSVREDRRPQSWKTMKLNPAKAGHAKRPPTPRKRNRKEPDSKVSQNNSSLAQAGSFGDRRVNEDHPARFGPRCVFIPFGKKYFVWFLIVNPLQGIWFYRISWGSTILDHLRWRLNSQWNFVERNELLRIHRGWFSIVERIKAAQMSQYLVEVKQTKESAALRGGVLVRFLEKSGFLNRS